MLVLSGRYCARLLNLEPVEARDKSSRQKFRDCSHVPAYVHNYAHIIELAQRRVPNKQFERKVSIAAKAISQRRHQPPADRPSRRRNDSQLGNFALGVDRGGRPYRRSKSYCSHADWLDLLLDHTKLVICE